MGFRDEWLTFLQAVHAQGGKGGNFVPVPEVGAACGFDEAKTREVFDYVRSIGYVDSDRRRVVTVTNIALDVLQAKRLI